MVLIPCYKEADAIGVVAGGCVACGYHTVVVDDGSGDATADNARDAAATVLSHAVNQGKGKAVETGIRYAAENGYDAVIVMDGDGQHLPSEIDRFICVFKETNPDFIIGTRMRNCENMPFVRRQTNRVMSWLLSREIGHPISDTQCGFRLIGRNAFPIALRCASTGFSAESEMLLQLGLERMNMCEVPEVARAATKPIRPPLDVED